jgi:uncharacterized membrane protein YhhN
VGALVHRATRVDSLIAFLALAAPVVFLLLLSAKPYPGAVALKSSLCVLLALLAWRYDKRLLASGLIFSAIGDALLELDATSLFIPALASFLITHVIYSVMFFGAAKFQISRLPIWRMVLLILIPIFAVVYGSFLWPKLGALTLPVVAYIVAIVVMTVLSLRVPITTATIGAVLFLVSDSCIALDRFLYQADWIGPSIWINYAAAQLLIAYGMMGSTVARKAVK